MERFEQVCSAIGFVCITLAMIGIASLPVVVWLELSKTLAH